MCGPPSSRCSSVSRRRQGSTPKAGCWITRPPEPCVRVATMMSTPWGPNMVNQPRSMSASTAASLISASFVAVISVKGPCAVRSRRCTRASARSGSASSVR